MLLRFHLLEKNSKKCIAKNWDVDYPGEPRAKPFEYSSKTVEKFTPEELKDFENV